MYPAMTDSIISIKMQLIRIINVCVCVRTLCGLYKEANVEGREAEGVGLFSLVVLHSWNC